MAEVSALSLVWQSESKTLKEITSMSRTDLNRLTRQNHGTQESSGAALLVKVQCMQDPCQCALNNQEVLMLKPFCNVAVICGVWVKNNAAKSDESSGGSGLGSSAVSLSSASSMHENSRHKVVLTQFSTSWFEVLNESGQSVAYWTKVRDLVRQQPKAFLLRKEMRCYVIKNEEKDGSEVADDNLSYENTVSLKPGTVLNFLESGKYKVLTKNGRSKMFSLVKCSDQRAGRLVFLAVDEKCAISPVAGPGNISGVHTVSHLVNQFHLPLRVRPVVGGFGDVIPDSIRGAHGHHLRLTELHHGDLLFLAPLGNPDRFYIVTPRMLEDHVFYFGESALAHHRSLLAQHNQKAMAFLQKYHEMEKLRYLLRHLQAENPKITSGQFSSAQSHISKRSHANSLPVQPPGSYNEQYTDSKDVDKLLDEVEDIYYYVRNGHMPPRLPAGLGPRTASLELSRTPFKPRQTTPQSQRHDPTARSAAAQQARSASCNNVSSPRYRGSPAPEAPPALPPRKYDSPDHSNNGSLINRTNTNTNTNTNTKQQSGHTTGSSGISAGSRALPATPSTSNSGKSSNWRERSGSGVNSAVKLTGRSEGTQL